MNSGFNKMEIEQIIFETGDQEVLLNANVVKGNLSYRSQLILNFTDLNLLLNKIQNHIGENEEISSLFDIEKMYDGKLLYTLDFEKKFARKILLDSIEFNHEIKQIRA
jgi:hypothetical protein